jgi:hypothetical protein
LYGNSIIKKIEAYMIKTKNILFNRFVQLIEKDHQEINDRFINDLIKNPDTPAYHNRDVMLTCDYCGKIYRDLSIFVSSDFPKKKIKEVYTNKGKDLMNQGIPFSQVQKATTLQKRHLWLYVLDKLYDDNTAYKEAIELNNRVLLFFDRATFYMLKGYEEILYKKF